MPELPEVETIMRGLIPQLQDSIVQDVLIRNHRLRWPISANLKTNLSHQKIVVYYNVFNYSTEVFYLNISFTR